MEIHGSRGIRSLIWMVSVLVCASAPLAAQRGIDLLNADEVLRLNAPRAEPVEYTSTVRLVASTDPEYVAGATHDTTTFKYDDGDFENYALAPPDFPPFETEVAQRFALRSSGKVVSVTVCFQRPDNDVTRDVVFDMVFYDDDDGGPGTRSLLRYTWRSTISRKGDERCLVLSGALAGKSLARGAHWVGISWQSNTNKILGEDRYTTADPGPTGTEMHETSVRQRSRGGVGAPWSEWQDSRATRNLKAFGIRMVVDLSNHTTTPDPDPDPDPDPGPAADSSCSGGTCLLQDDRFRVRTRYSLRGLMSQSAETVSAGFGGTAGLFTFGSGSPELLVRIVDDCDDSGYWALYAGAASDADYAIAVRDTDTDELRWFRARGGASIADTAAFACN